MKQAAWLGAFLGLGVIAGCGGAEKRTQEPPPEARAEQKPEPEEEQVAVEGIMGTIPQEEVESRLLSRQRELLRCFAESPDSPAYIAGEIEFYFRVDRNGEVEWVYPRGSTLGNRHVERCLLEVAKGTRFPSPRGGAAAEFGWSFGLESPGDVRPPVPWEEERVRDVVAERSEALQECGSIGGAVVTAYVAPGGEVVSVGVAVDERADDDTLDCIAETVKSWNMPDPGSYPAKVSFSLP